MSDLPLSRPLDVRRIPDGGQTVIVAASAAECMALARELGVSAIRNVAASVLFTPKAKGLIIVTGSVSATVTQACVRSLEPFEQEVSEEINVSFSPDPTVAVSRDEDGDIDAPDLLEGDTLDAGGIAAEFIALGLDPYPVKPGAELPLHQTGEAVINPFAVLSRLKRE
jgi:uncharacterized metal-binding protein YceD (DUF177 family)